MTTDDPVILISEGYTNMGEYLKTLLDLMATASSEPTMSNDIQQGGQPHALPPYRRLASLYAQIDRRQKK